MLTATERGFTKTGLPAPRPQARASEPPSPLWRQLATRAQFRLAVSRPGDASEREAERWADSVVSTPQAAPCAACAGGTSVCTRCKQPQVARRTASDAGRDATGELPAALGSGQALDPATRAFMEPRFGHDFGAVRVHVDRAADHSARAFDALAYTVGRDVVFRADQYAPHSDGGRRLLAHELSHVVQQRAAGPSVQREADFRVTQVQPDPARRTEGQPARFFFDLDRADLRPDVPEEQAERARLASWALAHAGRHVTLVGRASQEGSRGHNSGLARRRAATIRALLQAQGVVVDGVTLDLTYATRPVDYRFDRSVEVLVTGSGDVTCGPTQETDDRKACEDAFAPAHGRAVAIVSAALARLRPTTDPPAAPDPQATSAPGRDAILSRFFPGVARATLLPLFESVATRLGQVGPAPGSAHACHHRCVRGCERPASAAVNGPVNLCAAFYVPGFLGWRMGADERVLAVLHETTHSAPVPGLDPPESVGIDVAYAHARLFPVLEASEALRNADSFVMALLALAGSAGGAPAVVQARGSAPADVATLATPAGESGDRNRRARRAIGFAGAWLNYAAFWSPNLYDFIAASLSTWDATGRAGVGHALLELFAPLFRLEHPGTVDLVGADKSTIDAFQAAVATRGFPTPSPSRHARVQDRTRVAGVYDRLSRMYTTLKQPLAIGQATSGDGSWSTAGGLPGLGTSVLLADSFFTALTPAQQTRHVIRLMARAMSDVGGTWVEAYVEAADGVRLYRDLGP